MADFKSKIPELLIHNLWQSRMLPVEQLSCEDGRKINVLFPGWYNKGWGPDFKDAKIMISNDIYFGDIEIHIDEYSWYQHSHHLDEAYNKVILHVFLNSGQSQTKNQLGQLIPALCLGHLDLKGFWQQLADSKNNNLKNLPGACGLYVNDLGLSKLKKIVFQASESRLLKKSSKFNTLLADDNQEAYDDALYTSICRSIGYTNNVERFVSLAERYPYSKLKIFFKTLHRQSRVEILSRWFGYLDYLKFDLEKINPKLRREWATLQQHWSDITDKETFRKNSPKGPARPLNNALRRLHGLYYHLELSAFQGLTKTWLRFLLNCQAVLNEKKARSLILSNLDHLFPQPDWDPLNYHLSPVKSTSKMKKTKLIGRQRQLIILVNSIIPFFLCWSKKNGDDNLEKILFGLTLNLPSEGKNKKTEFMENRLFPRDDTATIARNLSYHQGLMQIYDNCCTSFYEGCNNCSLLKLFSRER